MPSPLRSTLALSALLGALTLTGCGIGTLDQSGSATVAPAMKGLAFGGANPIAGATVKVFSTGTTPGDGTSTNTAYGTGTLLQEANTIAGQSAGYDSDANGNFTFAGGYKCPAGQFAYLTVTGGNTGANTVNANSVLVAALGRCEDLYAAGSGGTYTGFTGTTVYVNELTTVAAAYALGRFSSITSSGAATVVGIGAPATNNAAQISGISTGCVAGVGACTTTAAAGLAHAFQNAINIISPFSNPRFTNGANATLPGNSSATLPQPLINTLGNILVGCVNSAGGIAGDSSPCGNIFTATTNGASVPVNTFSAMVNLAANPSLSGSTTNVANFYNFQTAANSVYSPNLTSSTGLNDFSIAVNYPHALGINYVQSGALDINDVFYAGNLGVSGTGPVNILAFGSNGTLLGTSASNATLKNAYTLVVDQKGFGYFGNAGGSSSSLGGSFATGGGSLGGNTVNTLTATATGSTTKFYALAIDKANNLWATGVVITAGNATLVKGAAGTAAPTLAGAATPTVTAPSSNFIGLAVDPQQNIWVGANTILSVLPNSGTSASSPAYANALLTATPAGNPVSGFAFPGTATNYTAYSTSYGQTVTTEGVDPIALTPAPPTPTITAITAGALSDPLTGTNPTITGSAIGQADGVGNVWLADTNSKSIIQYAPGATPTAYRLIPCLYNAATSQCATSFTTGKPNSIAIDSTGSIWTSSPVNSTASPANGSVIQIIGAAAPTWPILSLGLPARP